jgi:hypothetical protein
MLGMTGGGGGMMRGSEFNAAGTEVLEAVEAVELLSPAKGRGTMFPACKTLTPFSVML